MMPEQFFPSSRQGGWQLGAWVVLVAALMLLTSVVLAQSFPPLTGHVVDAANLLKPEARAAIEAKLKAHEDKTTDQLVVVTVSSLEGTTIEDYGYRLGRHWQLGQRGKNNGAILLVAPNDRKVRIEVGYGLEGALTDALSKVIITTAIAPQFQKGDFSGGIDAGVDAMLSILTGDAEEWQRQATIREDEETAVAMVVSFLLFLFFLYLVYMVIFSKGGPRRMHRTRSGQWVPVGTSGGSGSSWGGSSGGSSFSGGGGSFGGGGASGSW